MKPKPSAKNVTGDFDKFSGFMRRLMAVPHSEIKAQLDAEKEAKRTLKASVSRVSDGASRER
jgi:hypothetical protein